MSGAVWKVYAERRIKHQDKFGANGSIKARDERERNRGGLKEESFKRRGWATRRELGRGFKMSVFVKDCRGVKNAEVGGGYCFVDGQR